MDPGFDGGDEGGAEDAEEESVCDGLPDEVDERVVSGSSSFSSFSSTNWSSCGVVGPLSSGEFEFNHRGGFAEQTLRTRR